MIRSVLQGAGRRRFNKVLDRVTVSCEMKLNTVKSIGSSKILPKDIFRSRHTQYLFYPLLSHPRFVFQDYHIIVKELILITLVSGFIFRSD